MFKKFGKDIGGAAFNHSDVPFESIEEYVNKLEDNYESLGRLTCKVAATLSAASQDDGSFEHQLLEKCANVDTWYSELNFIPQAVLSGVQEYSAEQMPKQASGKNLLMSAVPGIFQNALFATLAAGGAAGGGLWLLNNQIKEDNKDNKKLDAKIKEYKKINDKIKDKLREKLELNENRRIKVDDD